ncbi:MAG: HdeD family acid-resistance protein [Vulcanimicrobiaceae bacterium]
MLQVLARNWWALLVRGIAAILFGILAFALPGTTLFVLVMLFGAYALVDGVFAFVAAVRAAEAHTRFWPLAVEGIVGSVIGLATFFYPGITAMALLFLIAAWAVLTGILEIAAALQLRRELAGEIWLVVSGVLSIAFGILIVAFPGGGVLAVLWILAVYAILFGAALVALGLRLRSSLAR